MLPRAVRKLSLKLNRLLHSSITEPKTFHLLAFLSFLEAALSGGRKKKFQETINRIRDLVGYRSAQGILPSLIPKAAFVLEELNRKVESSLISEEANVTQVVRETAEGLRGEVSKVIVVDAFSIIEFAALMVTCWRNSLSCDLRQEVFVNPRGDTWYVKRQVGGDIGYLRDYAAKLAEEMGCGRNFEVYPILDNALHEGIGDVVCFLEKNPFDPIWEKIWRVFQEEPTLFPYRLLLTSDHGYNVFEDESGTLYVGHGEKGRSVLRLDKVSLFAIITPRGGI